MRPRLPQFTDTALFRSQSRSRGKQSAGLPVFGDVTDVRVEATVSQAAPEGGRTALPSLPWFGLFVVSDLRRHGHSRQQPQPHRKRRRRKVPSVLWKPTIAVPDVSRLRLNVDVWVTIAAPWSALSSQSVQTPQKIHNAEPDWSPSPVTSAPVVKSMRFPMIAFVSMCLLFWAVLVAFFLVVLLPFPSGEDTAET